MNKRNTVIQEHMVSLRLDEHQANKLTEYAERYNTTKTAIIKEAITIWLNLNSEQAAK